MQRGDRHGRVLGEAAADREPDMGMTGLALPVVETKGVHTFAAAIARAAANMHLDADASTRGEPLVARSRYLPGELVTGHMRKTCRREPAREYLRVGRADHRRPDAHEDLARSRARSQDFLDREGVLRREDHGQHRRRDLGRAGGLAERARHARGRPG